MVGSNEHPRRSTLRPSRCFPSTNCSKFGFRKQARSGSYIFRPPGESMGIFSPPMRFAAAIILGLSGCDHPASGGQAKAAAERPSIEHGGNHPSREGTALRYAEVFSIFRSG